MAATRIAPAKPGGDFRHRAACLDEDPELFFPTGSKGPALAQAEQAKAVCSACPVTSECLAWSIRKHSVVGVWGGLTETERRNQKLHAGNRPEPLMCKNRHFYTPATTVIDKDGSRKCLPCLREKSRNRVWNRKQVRS